MLGIIDERYAEQDIRDAAQAQVCVDVGERMVRDGYGRSSDTARNMWARKLELGHTSSGGMLTAARQLRSAGLRGGIIDFSA